jgi:large subunit ribosomal protein L9
LAEPATPEAVNRISKIKEVATHTKEVFEEAMRVVAKNLEGKEFIIREKATKGKLFGSIDKVRIIDELKKEGFNLEEKMLKISDHIKTVGISEIDVQLTPATSVRIKLNIQEK